MNNWDFLNNDNKSLGARHLEELKAIQAGILPVQKVIYFDKFGWTFTKIQLEQYLLDKKIELDLNQLWKDGSPIGAMNQLDYDRLFHWRGEQQTVFREAKDKHYAEIQRQIDEIRQRLKNKK